MTRSELYSYAGMHMCTIGVNVGNMLLFEGLVTKSGGLFYCRSGKKAAALAKIREFENAKNTSASVQSGQQVRENACAEVGVPSPQNPFINISTSTPRRSSQLGRITVGSPWL